jgi:hypothetical protein
MLATIEGSFMFTSTLFQLIIPGTSAVLFIQLAVEL